ncbi:DUF5133 domain-containing protein [Streptomyces sp. WAC05374]|uniref:DUF5133 domain-containing protein n=1 Tax=Streptomyces sp. WAC05374 TaxID=2487420 RepID=UPI000F8667CC|nr:DUF5133 domain-containing protein [Streptomyces sp. WAC05374]RST13613.1 DUF5133 domain-containing protein [Streptomyces sp. WAC05374]TDF50481.1 DUF5133 domain-containing protein [Streptomyces sp. WAC05374]TDF51849.1 DUF5133 domain-containing protein [Streptomyces sp. WAC05374]TDF60735.1 DUF5133 domain-containing protein [Streptomyces sp. WAC05374]
MLLAHPAVLRELVARYESLCTASQELALAPDLKRRLDDVTYTLCVTTGTRHVDQALAAARARLAATAAATVTSTVTAAAAATAVAATPATAGTAS